MDAPQQPSVPKRPSLKITSSATAIGGSSMITPNSSFQQPTSPAPATPSQGLPKIRLKSKSQPPTPADARPPNLGSQQPAATNGMGTVTIPAKTTQTKAGRISKPSAKKRIRADSDDDDENATPAKGGAHPTKKTKITLKPTTPSISRAPTLKVKAFGRAPQKPVGEGYDSEAEDREPDPVTEEQFLFRMLPGEHCDYLRSAIQSKQIGLPKSQGGADFEVKWLDHDEGRRAAVTVKGQLYAAILLDLPTITEDMKTWDKKSMVKSADICQMLMVFAQVENEEQVKTAPLPSAVEHGHRWPHGITPPMHDARNRRFRKRLSKLEIKNKEAEVDRLITLDGEAETTRTEWVDSKRDESGEEDEEEEAYEEDAEGEVDDYFGDGTVGQQEEEDFEVDDAALEAEFLDTIATPYVETPGAMADAVTPGTATAPTPMPQGEGEAEGGEEEISDEDDEDDEDEEDEEDEEEDGDEDEDVAAIRNVITNLKKQLKLYEDQLAASVQPIVRKRLEGNIKNVKAEILLKKSAIGETEED
ncbi:TAFII55 protein conserved region-domain-containing protein [Chaetomium sp. MPI-SDFR-AT-0129]|nr:TAFII55 protein conserved region-domain-containing protein [Chaetomium sp. MPI-SDFR-AT-0129]